MNRSDFDFKLPERLVAQTPCARRADARLLVLSRTATPERMVDTRIGALPQYLRAGDLLVLNDTKVLKARLFGTKASGGRIEIFIEQLLGSHSALAQLRASKPPKPASLLYVDGTEIRVQAQQGSFFQLQCVVDFESLLEASGRVPLPPYIRRPDGPEDRHRYQTVYARVPGAVAAPTAGLHFDDEMLARLRTLGVEIGFVTLHVGAGTFQPMRVARVEDHRMHSERIDVSAALGDQIEATRARGGRVIAVGTTSVRSLEASWRDGRVRAYRGQTDIFIYPGKSLHAVDGLLTNFHLPQSTLLMLVCAFAGTERVLAAYRHAVAEQYRFFSYGDAMLIV